MDVHVSAAEQRDLDAVLDAWVALVESQRTYGSHIEGEANREAARRLLSEYIQADMLAVARSEREHPDGPINGFVMFYQEDGMYEQTVLRGVIENVYVKPSVRGDGVGTALLDYAERELKERDVEVVGIAAMAENNAVIDWYESRGYDPHRIIMERSLDGESKA